MRAPLSILLALVSAGAGAWGWHRARTGGEAPIFPIGTRPGATLATAEAEKAEMAAAFAQLPPGPITDWAERIAAARLEDFPRLEEETKGLPDKDAKTIRRLLAARWADLDAPGAWSALKDEDCVGAALDSWLRQDRTGMLAVLGAGAEPLGEGTLRWLETGHADCYWAIAVQTRHCPIDHDPKWETLVPGHEAGAEELAREWLDPSKPSGTRDAAAAILKVLAAIRAERDPHAAMEWVDTLEDGPWIRVVGGVLPFLSPEDLKRVCDRMALAPRTDGADNHREIPAYLTRLQAARMLAQTDAKVAIEWLSTLDARPVEHAAAVGNVIAASVREQRLSLDEAFALAERAGAKGELVQGVMRSVWREAPVEMLEKAAQRIKEGEPGTTPPGKSESLIEEWAGREPAAALHFIESLDPERRDGLIGSYFSARLRDRDDPDEVARALAELPTGSRGAAVARHLRALADLGWDGTPLTQAVESIANAETRTEATSDLCSHWARVDPRAAGEWAMRQADASVQQAGLSTVIGKWTEADAWGASQWLGKQPAGLGRDAGFQALATRIAPEEPESAWQWAGAIADPKIREDSLAAVVCEWEKADPTAAWAAVEQASGLTPAARQRLLDAVSHPENLLPPAP